MSHQVILARHLLGGESKRQRHGEGESFGDGHDDDGDGGDEDPEKGLALLLGRVVVPGKSGQKLDEEDGEEKQTSGTSQLCNVACNC